MNQPRDDEKRFDLKGDRPRIMRSMRLTDECWASLGRKATEKGCSRADMIEAYARIDETDQPIDVSSTWPMDNWYLLHSLVRNISEDKAFTRGGRDGGSVRRALTELINRIIDLN